MSDIFKDDTLQFSSKDEIAHVQDQLFRKHLQSVGRRSPYYKNLFQKRGIDFNTINLQDIAKLPFTSKEDIHLYGHDMLSRPMAEVIDIITTSGTVGRPITFKMTDLDLQRLAYNEYLSLDCAGITNEDVIQIMVTLDKRFMAGMAYYLGARLLGAGIIRSGVDSLAFQLDTLMRLHSTVLIAVPSFILKLIDFAETAKVNLKSSRVSKLICIGEAIRNRDYSLNTLGKRLHDRWPIELISTYASTEMSTAFTECRFHQGGHLLPNLIVAEILDEDDCPVPAGRPGELVVTPLGTDAMPLIRFKTGDVCIADESECGCERNTLRLGPILGRKKQMIKYKGTSFYPGAIFDVLNVFENVHRYLVTVEKDEYENDEVKIELCVNSTAPSSLITEIKHQLKSYIRVVPTITIIDFNLMKRMTTDPLARKPIKFIDRRDHSIQN